MRKNISIILGMISFVAVGFASGVKEDLNWVLVAKPYLIIWAVLLGLAIVIYNWNHIRRVTYPAIICVWAYLYEHKILTSDFAKHTYRVYTYFGKSYRLLYLKVQSAFDYYIQAK
jgi:hypothetical protein